jgi:hypothetical protein
MSLTDLVDLESAARRVEDLVLDARLSPAARAEVAWYMSDLVEHMDLAPGPVASALEGRPVDVDGTAEAITGCLSQLAASLADPTSTGWNPMDRVVVASAIGDAVRFVEAFSTPN